MVYITKLSIIKFASGRWFKVGKIFNEANFSLVKNSKLGWDSPDEEIWQEVLF